MVVHKSKRSSGDGLSITEYFKVRRDYFKDHAKSKGGSLSSNLSRGYAQIRKIFSDHNGAPLVGIQHITDFVKLTMILFGVTNKYDVLEQYGEYYLDELAWDDIKDSFQFEAECMAEYLREDMALPFTPEYGTSVENNKAHSCLLPLRLTNYIRPKEEYVAPTIPPRKTKIDNKYCTGACISGKTCNCQSKYPSDWDPSYEERRPREY